MADDRTTVYIVDDDVAVREALGTLLDIEGYDVRPYGTAGAFLADIGEAAVGIVLLDVRLPDANGLDVLASLRTGAPNLATIVMTGHGDIPMAVEAVKSGAADFVEKPFVGNAVIESVRAVLAEASRLSEDAERTRVLRERFARLTAREREVLRHLIRGQTNKEVARDLGLSPRTVEVHRANVMSKTEATSYSELLRMALDLRIDEETA